MTEEPEVLNDHGTEEHNGHELHVRRVSGDSVPYDTDYANEFELLVDGEQVTTASYIEQLGYENPWAPALFRFGRAYVEGLEVERK